MVEVKNKTPKNPGSIEFDELVKDFQKCLEQEFRQWNNCEDQLTQRGFSREILQMIMAHKPLSVAIPESYGGRGLKVNECLKILELASYESLPLSLIFGINIALFLEPLHKYGRDSVKPKVYRDFMENQAMGGLMISEPDHGSDALNMRTAFQLKEDQYHIKGFKHWQGLTGMADYWLVACRESNEDGQLGKDISMFLTDESDPRQKIEVVEYYNNNGLYPIPYGKNKIDIEVPADNRMVSKSSGIIMLMDVLHRSRMQFPGMGMGFIKRIMEEAQDHVDNRMIRGSSLLQFDQVKYHIVQLQSAFTICSAMCFKSAQISSVDEDLSREGMEANVIKALVTELMQRAAQVLIQLQGANGYKIMSLGSRAIMDSRPFQIFEGPNEMLFSQVAEAVLKVVKRKSLDSLGAYFKSNSKWEYISDRFGAHLEFGLDEKISQRKHVRLGEVISRVVCGQYVYEMQQAGFNSKLAEASLDHLAQEISSLVNSYKMHEGIMPVEHYQDSSDWNGFQS